MSVRLTDDPRIIRAHYIASFHQRELMGPLRALIRQGHTVAASGHTLTPDDLRSAIFGRRVELTKEDGATYRVHKTITGDRLEDLCTT